MDVVVYGDQDTQVRTVLKTLSNIIKANSKKYGNVEYEDPKKLPIFSFRPYKRRSMSTMEETKEVVQKVEN